MKTKENPFWAVGYVLVFLALQVLATTAATIVYSLVSGHPSGQLNAPWTIVSMVLFSLSAIVLFTLAKWSPVSRSYVLSRPWVVLGWSAVAAIGALLPSLFLQGQLPEWPEAIQKYIDEMENLAAQLMSTPGGYAVVCLLAPVAEELVFRGAALRTLLAWKPERRWLMIVLSALLFAVAHLNPAQLIHPFVIGLLLGWMYERTRSVLPGIVYHWANNTAAYLMYHAYPSTDITLTDIFGSEGRALMAVGFSLLIILPAIFQLHLTMKTAQTATLKRISERLNGAGITWAVGGSMMLYLRGRSTNVHDIDLMVDEREVERAKDILDGMGKGAGWHGGLPLQPDKNNGQFQTRHYHQFVIDGTDVDLIAGFVIVKDGVAHECPLLRKDITERHDLEGTPVPLHSLSVWKEYYALMGRTEKVALCE